MLKFIHNTSLDISENPRLGNDQKVEQRKAVSDLLKSIGIRAILILLVHFRSGAFSCLFISSVVGFFSILENSYTFQTIKKQYPNFFAKEA